MNFEPQKFFIGLVDFFSIILPGMFVAYLGGELVPHDSTLFPDTNEVGWGVFLFVSYFLGHFIFLIGALLDEWIYDPMRAWTDLGQTKRLSKGKGLSPELLRRLAPSYLLFGPNPDRAVTKAERLKTAGLQQLSAENTINAFQWCKARLALESPEGLAQVQRFEADAKFFRSFVVALAIFGVIYAFREDWLRVVIAAVLGGLALYRYVEQRFKTTQQAYWLVITKEGLKNPPAPAAAARADGLTHAGGIVFRKSKQGLEYLLVGAKDEPSQLLLPKGHIEAGEQTEFTAVREVREETGTWARVLKPLDTVEMKSRTRPDTLARVFLMEAVEEGDATEERPKSWLDLESAKKAAMQETQTLLGQADKAVREMRDYEMTPRFISSICHQVWQFGRRSIAAIF
ncbi:MULTISPECIES: NUDIX domain-containing protein [Rhizobium]|uniref:RNA pyrophosphohydrolase n=1 Tax=Rhizobium favelukesii TaxID=348824 RepID=W6R8E5_9HYPH|nr:MULTISPECIES: NUDIX domain-containing protein [Rhizobium]MCS0462728.1 NUDIX domain-containing protein [Rhizobium favelukesii]UFS80956.1 NUDIX domain-containing protein [Rhizobium sp. T136]CDM57512.1 RNA pyrophosphohydrolase [Rhizobium favelukesii]